MKKLWTSRGGAGSREIDIALSHIDAGNDAREHQNYLRGMILEVAQVQTDTLIALAATRVNDDDLVKESLRRATLALQDLIRSLEQDQARALEGVKEDRERLKEIGRSLGHE